MLKFCQTTTSGDLDLDQERLRFRSRMRNTKARTNVSLRKARTVTRGAIARMIAMQLGISDLDQDQSFAFAAGAAGKGLSGATPQAANRDGLLWRLQSRRVYPVFDMGSRIGLTRFLQQRVSLGALQQPCSLARLLCERDEAILYKYCLLETAPLFHGDAPCSSKAGARQVSQPPAPTEKPRPVMAAAWT
jgi:hypothetical protein